MLEKDYIKKQFDIFLKELVKLLSSNFSEDEKVKEISNLSKLYVNKNVEYFITTSAENIISEYGENEEKLDIIIELLFQMYNLFPNKMEEKITKIILHTNQISSNFSFRRNNILEKIRKIIENKGMN